MTYPTSASEFAARWPWFALALAPLTLAALHGGETPRQAMILDAAPSCAREELDRLPAALVAADNRRDLEGVLALYSEDAVWFPPAGEPIVGRAAIRERYLTLFTARPALRAAVRGSSRDAASGTVWGKTSGSIEPLAAGSARQVDDDFALTARCAAGKWKVTLLAWRPAGSMAGRGAAEGGGRPPD